MKTLLTNLRDEADLCRNETADDIANLLDEAATALEAWIDAAANAIEAAGDATKEASTATGLYRAAGILRRRDFKVPNAGIERR